MLKSQGIREPESMEYVNIRKSYWRTSNSPILSKSLTNMQFRDLGFCSFQSIIDKLQRRLGNSRVPNSTHGGVGGRPFE